MELTAVAAFQTVSWIDLWSLVVAKIASSSSGSRNSEEGATFRRLMLSGGRPISYLAHRTTNLWANLVLKRRDAVLTQVTRFVGT